MDEGRYRLVGGRGRMVWEWDRMVWEWDRMVWERDSMVWEWDRMVGGRCNLQELRRRKEQTFLVLPELCWLSIGKPDFFLFLF